MTGWGRGSLRARRPWGVLWASTLLILLTCILVAASSGPGAAPKKAAPDRTRSAAPTRGAQPALEKTLVYPYEVESPAGTHPKHVVKVWLTTYRGRTFRVTQLPRCEHLEAVIAYNPKGETLQQAKQRLGGVAASTGSFHNPKTMGLVDFLQEKGNVISGASTGRWFLAVLENGDLNISDNYLLLKGKSGVSAIALGQRLVPLRQDGFSKAFMNAVTDRMALGLSTDYIFIVQGKSDIWRLADFMEKKLPVKIALNADGGHVVRGRAPVHIVFRWRQPPSPPTLEKKAQAAPAPVS